MSNCGGVTDTAPPVPAPWPAANTGLSPDAFKSATRRAIDVSSRANISR